MTMRYRGGGHKRRYRVIDFKRDKKDVKAEVKSIQYDPNRSAFIALVEYTDGEKRYVIAQTVFRLVRRSYQEIRWRRRSGMPFRSVQFHWEQSFPVLNLGLDKGR